MFCQSTHLNHQQYLHLPSPSKIGNPVIVNRQSRLHHKSLHPLRPGTLPLISPQRTSPEQVGLPRRKPFQFHCGAVAIRPIEPGGAIIQRIFQGIAPHPGGLHQFEGQDRFSPDTATLELQVHGRLEIMENLEAGLEHFRAVMVGLGK